MSSINSGAETPFTQGTVYDQRDAEGFIKLQALRLKLLRQDGRVPEPPSYE